MYSLNKIDIKHINNLSDIQLSQLLHILIRLEAEKYNLQEWDESVPFNITTGDAGSDGRIQWNGIPATTRWLKNPFTIFQIKATDLTPSKCSDEILLKVKKGSPRKLKSQIEKVVRENGCYILFTNKSIVDKGKHERIINFRKAIKLAGEVNHATFQILVYDSNSIKDWVNEYIAAVTLVQEFNGVHRPQGFIEWKKWEKLSKAMNNPFQSDDTVKNNILLIQKSIKSEKVIRLTGHSGLGKTRLILETFRDTNLQNSVVYINLEGSSEIKDIKNYILSYQDSQDGIIIIDNCDVKCHLILSALAEPTGNLKIITIGLEDNNAIQDLKIKIDRNNQRTIVYEIIQQKIGATHQLSDIEYISTISEGYPWMAIRFCDIVLKKGMSELSKIPLDEFIPKLIFGSKLTDEIEYGVIRACSVFSSFGFLDDSFINVINDELKQSLTNQMSFIRTRIYDGTISETKFNEICNKFIKEDIIERRGTLYIVKPTLLAINLAADWLLSTGTNRIIEIIKELKQVDLEEKFVDRLKDLDQIDKAKDIVAELWGPNSLFGSAEVLNTSSGSLLFRYVVEVNPIATAQTLQTSFGKMTKEEILKIDTGRRNLVWALEKLCLRKETFETSAKTLYSFAVSENETWGNNSTNQFQQLFQLFLSGTEANLRERLKVIKWGLCKGDDDYTQIAIMAMSNGLKTGHYSRLMGAEKQGSGVPLQDNYPTSEEIIEYWNDIIVLLEEIAISDNLHAVLAKDIIADSIRNLISEGQWEIISTCILKIIVIKGNLWPNALNNLKMTLSIEKHLPEEIINDIKNLISALTPTDTKNQLFLKVTKPEWYTYEKDDNEHYIDHPKLAVEIFAKELVDKKIEWIEYIKDLLQGEQRQAFNFGAKYASLVIEKAPVIEKATKALKKISKDKQNPELVAGLLYGSGNRNLFERTIDIFISDDTLRQHSFYLTRVMNPSYTDITKLFTLVDKYEFPIYHFQNFQYGRALDSLDSDEVIKLCSKIIEYGYQGKWTALSLIYMASYSNETRWNMYQNFIKGLISSSNITINDDKSVRKEIFHWSDLVIKLLNSSDDKEFPITITKQIIELCSKTSSIFSFNPYVGNVVTVLLDKYFNIVWEDFGEGIIGNHLTYSHLSYIIDTLDSGFVNEVKTIFNNPIHNRIIFNWCKRNYPKAPERIANMMPLNITKDNIITWHPFSRLMIDEFGESEQFLNYLSSNMGTFGAVGSRIPYFTTQKILLEDLLNHKFQTVKDWANERLKYIEIKIKRERINDEENS